MSKKRTIKQIEKEIAALKTQLDNVQGSKCEIYARICGYYRPVKNWNKGKSAEYKQRIEFEVEERI